MIDLVKLGEKTYCLKGATNIGIYLLDNNNVCVIDTGYSKEYGEYISKVLEEHNWHLKFIINTHSHSDHISGNSYLQKKYNCKVYASLVESYFINTPILEPSFLYSAKPISDLCHHFLLASPSNCEDIANLDARGIKYINLEGHSIGSIGILTSDNVLFAGDAYTSKSILAKYSIQYVYDVERYLLSLNKIVKTNYNYYIPAHGDIEKYVQDTIKANQDNALKIEKLILDYLKDGVAFDDLIKYVFDYYHITINLEQYHLISSTIKSFLTKLVNENKIKIYFIDNTMMIKKTIL